MKNKTILALIASLSLVVGGLWFWNSETTPNTECVTVYVDSGVLGNGEPSTTCVDIEGESATALDVLRSAGYQIEGTAKYGAQIVCRVNDLPSATEAIGIEGHEDYVESCAEMPAAFAYWAVLVKVATDNKFDVTGEWGWAQTGIDEVELNKGDSIGLVFADNENVRFPN